MLLVKKWIEDLAFVSTLNTVTSNQDTILIPSAS
jgi:hypothetical protein